MKANVSGSINGLQNTGMAILGVFFYFYTVGGLFGRTTAYLSIFYVAIVIAIIMFIRGGSLKEYSGFYKWQAIVIFVSLISAVLLSPQDEINKWTTYFPVLLKTTTVAIICRDFEGVKKLLVVLTLDGLLIFATLFFTGNLFVAYRLGTDIMGNSNSFAMVICFLMIGALYWSFYSENRFFKVLSIAILLIDLYMIVLSGGRKFLLFFIVFFYGLLLMRSKATLPKIIIVSIIAAIVVGVGYYLIMNVESLYNGIGYRFDGLGTAEGAEGVDDQEAHMRRGIEMFLEKPIFGWGFNAFKDISGFRQYAHSNYVEILADFGIIGIIIYYYFHIYCAVKMWVYSRRKIDDEMRLYFPLILAIIVFDIFTITICQTAYIPLLLMLIGGYTYRLEHHQVN